MQAKWVLLYSCNFTQLAKRGMNIMLMSRSQTKLEKVAVEIGNVAQIRFFNIKHCNTTLVYLQWCYFCLEISYCSIV